MTGTWTLKRRAGWIKRTWRLISTLRYDSKKKGWINRLGLPNEGLLHGLNKTSYNDILSIENKKILDTKIIYTIVNGIIYKNN